MQILRPGARVPACLLQLTGLLGKTGPTLKPGNSSCLCVHAANSPPWGFGWALGGCCARVDPECLKPPPETPGYVLQSQQISAAHGHAVSSCSPRQEETLSLRQLSEIPNVLLCPAGMGRRLRGGEKPPKGPGLWQQPSAGAGAAKFSSITSIGTQRAARLGKEGKGRARDPARPRGAACGLCKPRRLALGSERV